MARTPASRSFAAASTVDRRSSHVDIGVEVTRLSWSQNSSTLRACSPRRPSMLNGRPIRMAPTPQSLAVVATADRSADPPTRISASIGVTTVPEGSEMANPIRTSPKSTASTRPQRLPISGLLTSLLLPRSHRAPLQTHHRVWRNRAHPPAPDADRHHRRRP